jgi:DNA-binding NarL/FixJ family response regulator
MAADKRHIVIIDDSDIDRERYRRFLQNASTEYVVHEAADQKTGIDLVRTVRPACVLLDLRLSKESGFEVLQLLRQSFPLIPVIMLTGARWRTLKEGAVSLGAQAYLIKDQITPETLDQAIRQALAP